VDGTNFGGWTILGTHRNDLVNSIADFIDLHFEAGMDLSQMGRARKLACLGYDISISISKSDCIISNCYMVFLCSQFLGRNGKCSRL